MNHLDWIVSEVDRNGSHEAPWHGLLNTYFAGGPGGLDRIEAWAREHGLAVSFSDERRTCLFRREPDRSR